MGIDRQGQAKMITFRSAYFVTLGALLSQAAGIGNLSVTMLIAVLSLVATQVGRQ